MSRSQFRAASRRRAKSIRWGSSLKAHWPEYAIEAAGVAAFMTSALGFTVLLEHPDSPVHQAIASAVLRRALMGLAMGSTAVVLVYSPWGQRSGAHFNPALTFTYLRLGKVKPDDALFCALAQFFGAIAGVFATAHVIGAVADPHVRFAVTLPGSLGVLAAFAAEVAISFGLMFIVLCASNAARTARFTGMFCGLLVATYITVEAPISGMSMNPARTLGSAAGAAHFASLWIYFTAPPLGMLLAAEVYLRTRGAARVRCAKLQHGIRQRCIFCGHRAA
ncbi:MAG: aquaporin family protein [Deltaproteobacteria bacterium]|nr:MAG: aquaporin family protein [Deltaproteobacteria bacterium]